MTSRKSANTQSRRGFWRNVIGRAVVARDELRGIWHISFAQLAELPDEEFVAMQLTVSNEFSLEWHDGVLHAVKANCTPQPINCSKAEGQFLITYIDSFGSIATAAKEYALQMKIEEGEACNRLRQAAELLIRGEIVVPTSLPDACLQAEN